MTIFTEETGLFARHPRNPILQPSNWPYSINSVFNAGVTRLPDGSTLLLCRCEDRRGFSHLTVARSKNGVDEWDIDPQPTLLPDPANYPEELYGIEDPRITYMPEEDRYLIAYTSFGKAGPAVSLAETRDFETFERIGLVMQPDDKDAALFPRKFGGEYALIHRPISDEGGHIWISFSPDLRKWGGHKLVLPARQGAWWDARKIGLSPPPIETERGWLILYHGVRNHASGSIYRLGLALFDLEHPERCLVRGPEWVMRPQELYEIQGDVPYVVFPCGFVLEEDGDTIRLYYGAADTCIAMATASIREMLDWLEEHGSEFTGIAGTEEELLHLRSESH